MWLVLFWIKMKWLKCSRRTGLGSKHISKIKVSEMPLLEEVVFYDISDVRWWNFSKIKTDTANSVQFMAKINWPGFVVKRPKVKVATVDISTLNSDSAVVKNTNNTNITSIKDFPLSGCVCHTLVRGYMSKLPRHVLRRVQSDVSLTEINWHGLVFWRTD